jgi:YVTN family beta-propeller protein
MRSIPMRETIIVAAIITLTACGAPPPAAAADKATSDTMLVANKRGNSLSRVDFASGQEAQQVASCANPHELAVSPDRAYVALACYSGRELEIYRTADLTRVKTIDLGEGARPHGVVWHDNGTLYSTAQGRGSIFVVRDPLSTRPDVREIGGRGGAEGPHLLVVNDSGTVAWGTVVGRGTVVRYDLAAGREDSRKVLGGQTEGIALAPDEGALWVGSTDGAKVYRLDPKTLEVLAEVPTGARPMRVATHPAGRWVVTSDLGNGQLTVIDGESNTVARSVPVARDGSSGQVTLVFSQDGSRLYAAETAKDTVAEVDFESSSVLRRLPAGDGGDGLAVF